MTASPLRFDALRAPEAIRAATFGKIAVESAPHLSALPQDLHALAQRLAYAAGDPALPADLAASSGAVGRGIEALRAGAPVLTDTQMLLRGLSRAFLPAENDALCMLALNGVAGTASRLRTTRAAAAVEYWRPWLENAVVAIGNAPTALFHLLERISEGWPKPALVLGFPVGFTGAAESKEALIRHAPALALPFITLRGRRGGSAVAAAAVNALALAARGGGE